MAKKEELVEEIPENILAQNRKNRWILCVVQIAVWGSVTGLPIVFDGDFSYDQKMLGVFLFFFMSALVFLAFTRFQLHFFEKNIPLVRLLGNELTIEYGGKVLAANIKDCRVFEGAAHRMRLHGGGRLFFSGSVILIALPNCHEGKLINGIFNHDYIVAVGYNDESKKKWYTRLGAP